MLNLLGYILGPALTISKTTPIFLLEIGRRLLFRVIRLFDAAEALINQIQEHTLGQVAEFSHSLQHF
jgi:hypothetical protein